MIHAHFLTPLGVVLILAGAVIRYKIGKRKFNRRSITGLELFPSYGKGIATRFMESVATIIAKLMILTGILLILANTL